MTLEFKEVVEALSCAGIGRGDTLLVTSRLFTLGPVALRKEDATPNQFYYGAIREVIGAEGTIAVPTHFEDYGRFGTPFDREKSPSRGGVFSEFVRTHPGAVRSMHPIMSVTAIGAKADEICGGLHVDGFGYTSPWGVLHRMNAKNLMLGLELQGGGGIIIHYCEHLFGVPYLYTKLYDTPVYADGEQLPYKFTLSVRYLDYGIDNNNARPLQDEMLTRGLLRRYPLGRGHFMLTRIHDVMQVLCEKLSHDRYYLLEQPPAFRAGEIPFDGQTGKLKKVYSAPNEREL